MTAQAVWLLAGLLFAHYLGDFTRLATARMLAAKANGGPLLPIAEHAAVHTLLVAAVLAVLVAPAWTIVAAAAAIEFLTHFAIDAARARLGVHFATLKNPDRSAFWYVMGFDQLAHTLVLVGLAWFAL